MGGEKLSIVTFNVIKTFKNTIISVLFLLFITGYNT